MTKPKKDELIREQPMTYEDYAALPDVEGLRYELNDGVLELMSPAPSITHQILVSRLLSFLQRCEIQYILLTSPIDVILSPKEVRQPDIVMIHRSRLDILTKRGIEGPPDLVVEILSPHSAKRDKVQKLASYARYQIPEYWIIDPANEWLEQHVLQNNMYELSNIFMKEEHVHSANIACASFTMQELMKDLPELRD